MMATPNQTKTMPNEPAAILEYSSKEWEVGPHDSKGRLHIPSLPKRCYVFLDKKSYPKSESDRVDILRQFNVPDFLSNKTCTDLNGYFGCKGKYDEAGKLEAYSTWFRCLVKMVRKTEFSADDDTTDDEPEYAKPGKSYMWFEMGFFTLWNRSGDCRVLCVDTPNDLPTKLKTVLRKQAPLDFNDPFAMHVSLIDQIILLYDLSIWRARHPVRDIEKNRLNVKPDFANMHDISRHAIHVSEVLLVTVETMKGLQRQQKAVHKSLSSGNDTTPYHEQAQEYMSFQLEILKSLKLRSDSNHERLKNEITLAYNIIVGQDNKVIKSIALLTMTFLPATFFSAFFSMTFFTFSENGWKASQQIWIYLVVSIPSTLLVLAFWNFWLHARSWKRFFEGTRHGKVGEKSPRVGQTEQEKKTEPVKQTERVGQREMV